VNLNKSEKCEKNCTFPPHIRAGLLAHWIGRHGGEKWGGRTSRRLGEPIEGRTAGAQPIGKKSPARGQQAQTCVLFRREDQIAPNDKIVTEFHPQAEERS
jgi:hypothetical protein